MASGDSQVNKPQRGYSKRVKLPDVNINTGVQSINTEIASEIPRNYGISKNIHDPVTRSYCLLLTSEGMTLAWYWPLWHSFGFNIFSGFIIKPLSTAGLGSPFYQYPVLFQLTPEIDGDDCRGRSHAHFVFSANSHL